MDLVKETQDLAALEPVYLFLTRQSQLGLKELVAILMAFEFA